MHSAVPFYSLEPQHRLLRDEVMAAIERVYEESQFISGDSLTAFEKDFADFTSSKHCVGVANGTDAIELSLRALGVCAGDEVIVPSHTFIATWLAVAAVGATPLPVEPDIVTFIIKPESVEKAITKRTKAVIPVHLYGQSCDMTGIMQVARKYNLFVVEDNAQSQGAMYRGKCAGSFGHCGATSFYPVKNLGALGDGGAITTSDDDLAEKLRGLRNYGSVTRSLYSSTGRNSRLDEIQAAILSVKLRHLPTWNSQRTLIANQYLRELKGVGDVVLPETALAATHVYHRFVIRTGQRGQLSQFLESNGVQTMVHYPVPPHLQPAFSYLGYRQGNFPVAEEIANTCLSLPLWPGMSSSQTDQVVEAVRKFWS